MPLFLYESDVESLLTMRDALEQVEAALKDAWSGKAQTRPRQRVRGERGVLHVMPGGWLDRGYFGFKAYTAARGGVRFFLHLFDATSGDYLAIIQADRLGQMRTGAASGVATKYLARGAAKSAGIIGTGWQAEAQLQAICAVRPIERVRCYSRDENKRRKFAERLSQELRIPVEPVESAEQAVRECEVVTTITNAATPVVKGEWLMPGAHVNAAGSNWAMRREVDSETVRRAACIFADSVEQAKIEAGDLALAVAEGALEWQRVQEFAALLGGHALGRRDPAEITLFKSCGIALEDVAVGALVYERAVAQGKGAELHF